MVKNFGLLVAFLICLCPFSANAQSFQLYSNFSSNGTQNVNNGSDPCIYDASVQPVALNGRVITAVEIENFNNNSGNAYVEITGTGVTPSMNVYNLSFMNPPIPAGAWNYYKFNVATVTLPSVIPSDLQIKYTYDSYGYCRGSVRSLYNHRVYGYAPSGGGGTSTSAVILFDSNMNGTTTCVTTGADIVCATKGIDYVNLITSGFIIFLLVAYVCVYVMRKK